MTSKPSNTNYPKASEWRGQSLNLTVGSFTLFFQYVMILVIHLTGSGLKMDTTILGVYSDGVPPLPIPNREVKPVSADGTAEMWESRSTPTFKKSLIPYGVRLFFICIYLISGLLNSTHTENTSVNSYLRFFNLYFPTIYLSFIHFVYLCRL